MMWWFRIPMTSFQKPTLFPSPQSGLCPHYEVGLRRKAERIEGQPDIALAVFLGARVAPMELVDPGPHELVVLLRVLPDVDELLPVQAPMGRAGVGDDETLADHEEGQALEEALDRRDVVLPPRGKEGHLELKPLGYCRSCGGARRRCRGCRADR